MNTEQEDAQIIPLSHAQLRLWFLDQQRPTGSAYQVFFGVLVRGVLDVQALGAALQACVDRHEPLRTVFLERDGQVYQRVLPESTVSMPVLQGDLGREPRAALERWLDQEWRATLPLTGQPSFRAALTRLDETRHLLLLRTHHLVIDGWSAPVLLRDLAQLYAARRSGGDAPAPLQMRYRDFVRQERDWLTSAAADEARAYWKSQLAGLPALQLPTDVPPPAERSARGDRIELAISPEVVEALDRLRAAEGCSLFVVLLSAWMVLLHRYTGQASFGVGSFVANRDEAESRGLVGYFAGTVALRAALAGDSTFRALLLQQKDRVREALLHGRLPYDEVVKLSGVPGVPGRDPLIQAAFVYQTAQKGDLADPDTAWSLVKLCPDGSVPHTAKFDLTLSLETAAAGVSGMLSYSTDLFGRETIERMVSHYQNLLRSIVRASHGTNATISQLSLLPESEREQILRAGNDAAKVYPRATLTELFAAQVAARPDATAVTFQDESLSYRALDARAHRLAQELRALGIGPGMRVGVCLERSLELCVALLAVLKAGGAYVPLDPSYPAERLHTMAADAGVTVVLTQAPFAGLLRDDMRRVLLDSQEEREKEPANAPFEQTTTPRRVTPDDVAYVIYTSGSTGRPKGVEVTHGNVARLFHATEAWFHFGPDDVWTLFHSYAFDFSVWEIWGAWVHGGRLVVVSQIDSRTPDAFHALLCREHVTVLNQTPSAFRQLIHADAAAPARRLPLRYVIFGGEALDPTMLRPWFERHGDQEPALVNMYGITETTVHVTYRPITAADAERPTSLIGRPIPDLQLYVLDAYQELSPLGVPGELYVGGAGVSRGYLNRPELTKERFIPRGLVRAFAATAGSGDAGDAVKNGPLLYRSGDLARLLPSGEFEYLGRIDSQIKIRGFRIELGEVEAALCAHPGVREAVVLGQDGADGHRFLAAYLVPSSEAPAPAELRAYLQTRLPDYMVPATFTILEALPLGENGKLDRKALLRPNQPVLRSSVPTRFVPPQTPHEALLAEIWADVLGRGPVGVHDNFFDLGGDSILSIRVLARAREAGCDFSLQQLFKRQTIRDLLRATRSTPTTQGDARAPRRTAAFSLCAQEDRSHLPADVEDAYPLAALQLGMFFHSSLDTGAGVYHDIFSYHLRAAFEQGAFEQALGEVIAHHPILRTGIALTGYSQPLQLVHRAAPADVAVEDLSSLAPAEQEHAIARWFAEQKLRGFNPAVPPLLRVKIHRRSASTFNLSVSFHHAILDGWSNALLLTELLQRYFALRGGRSSLPVAPPASSFRDFVALEREVVKRAEDRQYWQGQLADMVFLKLPRWPGAAPSPTVEDETSGMASVPIPAGVRDGIKRLSLAAGVPMKSALLAAHMRVLAALSNQDDSQTGLVTNGRIEEEGGEQVIGLFLNTVPFRLKITDVSWQTLARHAFHAECELLPFRRFPLSEIQALAGGGRVFETGFNFVHFHALQATSAIEDLELVDVKVFERHNYTLAVIFSLDAVTGELSVNLVHDTAALPAAQVQRIADYYQRTLAAMAKEPLASCVSFSPLSAAEREQILRGYSRCSDEVLPEATPARLAPELFERQVARTPDATALVGPSGEGSSDEGFGVLTYWQLNERANQLAHHLRSLGVGRGALVGVYLPRSIDLIVGFLGILKAGGVYLPLDPTYPQERLGYMLEDARPLLILTQRALSDSLPRHASRVLLLDAEAKALAQQPRGELDHGAGRAAGPEDPAYVIYTSGTTGRPRGVLVPHRGLPNLAAAQIRAFGVTPQSRVLQFASPNFDASISEILTALCSGAALHLPRPEALLSSEALLSVLRGQGITHVTLPPSLLAILPDSELPALSTLVAAGEPCPPALAARWGRGRRFLNAYGPTETTVCATLAEVTTEDTREPLLHIGTPMAGAEVYLLDSRLMPVPVGTPGEICIGGIGVARGYLNQPELTAQKFVENPFGAGSLYRTGDLGRFRPDGRIDFLGRSDDQVKLRGFRIEPEEIRAVLSEHPHVQDSVVVARASRGGQMQLVAYLSRKQVAPEPVSELWPSTFEFPILDDLLYHAMVADDRRMGQYKAAIEKVVSGRVVVEIGTGPQAALTILCAQAGAKKVYSIELSPEAHRSAGERIKSLDLEGVVELFCADARTVELPERADVCVSAIFGSIGGAEGAAVILNGARRLLRPGGIMLPERTTTRIVAVSLPDEIRSAPRFSEVGRHYAQKIFEHVGRPFDLRLCISKVPLKNHLSGVDVFEDLDFSQPVPLNEEHEIVLAIDKAGRFDGFLVGAQVTFTPGVTLDVLEGEHSHLPVFLPVFDPGIDVAPGDVLRAMCTRRLSEDGLHPDFALRGKLVRRDGSEVFFSHESRQIEPRYKATPFHHRLFEQEELRARGTQAPAGGEGDSAQGEKPTHDLRAFLRRKLPETMVPAVFVELAALPRTPSGKIDRRALPDPDAQVDERKVVAPKTELEREIAAIWKEVLQIPQVGVHDNFFDLGGHSLLLMIVLNKLQENRATTIEMVELFEHPTISALANHLRQRNIGPAQAGPRPAESGPAPATTVSAEEIKRQRLAAREQRRQARQGGRS